MTHPSKDSPLLARSGHRVELDVELNSYTPSNQVDFHRVFIYCTDLIHLQVEAEIEVVRESENKAETEVKHMFLSSVALDPLLILESKVFKM